METGDELVRSCRRQIDEYEDLIKEYDKLYRENKELLEWHKRRNSESKRMLDENQSMIDESRGILDKIKNTEDEDETAEYTDRFEENIRRIDENIRKVREGRLTDGVKMAILEENIRKRSEIDRRIGEGLEGIMEIKDMLKDGPAPGVDEATRKEVLDDISRMHTWRNLENITVSADRLLLMTGFDPDKFDRLSEEFADHASGRPHPQFNVGRYTEPENRGRPSKRHALLMALSRKKIAVPPNMFEIMFGVDRDRMSEYLDFSDNVLYDILPTAAKITARLQAAGSEQLEELVPGRAVLIDRLHSPFRGPDWQAGKATASTTVVSGLDGLILATGRTEFGPGAAPRAERIGLGAVLDSIYDPGEHGTVTVYAAPGLQGIESGIPGARVVHLRKKPRDGKIILQPKRRRRGAYDKKTVIHHAVGSIGQHRVMSDPYGGTEEQFRRDLAIVTGMVNLHLLWDAGHGRIKI